MSYLVFWQNIVKFQRGLTTIQIFCWSVETVNQDMDEHQQHYLFTKVFESNQWLQLITYKFIELCIPLLAEKARDGNSVCNLACECLDAIVYDHSCF